MSDKKDLLGKYTKERKPYPAMELVKPNSQNQVPYVAMVEITAAAKDLPKNQFRIVDKDGGFEWFDYSHLLKGSFKNGAIILTTTTDIVTLKGANLGKIAQLFTVKKVGAVYEFDAVKHQTPSADAAMIERIEWE